MPGSISYEKAALIIAAAGSSTRMGGKVKKEYVTLNSGTVLSEVVRIFLQTGPFSVIAVTVPHNGETTARKALFADSTVQKLLENTNLIFIPGGKTRQSSVLNALKALKQYKVSTVLIHDGARPFITPEIIEAVMEETFRSGAAVPAVHPTDTQKEINGDGIITRHLNREKLAAVQTPQGFRYKELLEAHLKAAVDGQTYTDDTEIWANYCGSVHIVPGDVTNKKITYPGDIPLKTKNTNFPQIRTGLGYDLHQLVPGRKLLLGGICLPFTKGESGHSDGDVLFHAITDAVLGAAAIGDIGSFFPPSDIQWKDADSSQLLKTAWKKVTDSGWTLGNMDCVIALEQPHFNPHRDAVRDSIAAVLNVPSDRIFVKAKTGEKLGKIGRSEAVEAWVTCLLFRD